MFDEHQYKNVKDETFLHINSKDLGLVQRKKEVIDGDWKDLQYYDDEIESKSVDMNLLSSLDPVEDEIEDLALLSKICEEKLKFAKKVTMRIVRELRG